MKFYVSCSPEAPHKRAPGPENLLQFALQYRDLPRSDHPRLNALLGAVEIQDTQLASIHLGDRALEALAYTPAARGGLVHLASNTWTQFSEATSRYRIGISQYRFSYDPPPLHRYHPSACFPHVVVSERTSRELTNVVLSEVVSAIFLDRFYFSVNGCPDVFCVGEQYPMFSPLFPFALRLGELQAPVAISTTEYGTELLLLEDWGGASSGLVAAARSGSPFVTAVAQGRWAKLVAALQKTPG